jgi:Cof subfamily protein (haloacid dehalogenase superfamily)
VVKLVAFDVDGTLVGRGLGVSDRVRAAIARMRERGIAGALVTGRMYRAALPFARELHFDAPIVCYQGAAVIDPGSDEIIFHRALDNAVALELVDIAAGEGAHLQLYRNDEYYAQSRNRFSDLYASLAGIEPVIVSSLRASFAYSDATKAVVIADAPDAERIANRLAAELKDRAYVTRSLPEFVEILNPSVDKGAALAVVAKRLGVQTEEILAIGDSWNDAPLLRAVGIGVAMGSAPEELRSIAHAVVADVEHDGVAEAIDRYVLA